MILGNPFFAKSNVALRANKRRVFLPLIDLEIQSATIVAGGRDMASVRSATGTHGNFQSLGVERIHRRHVVTSGAIQVGMLAAFMTESSG